MHMFTDCQRCEGRRRASGKPAWLAGARIASPLATSPSGYLRVFVPEEGYSPFFGTAFALLLHNRLHEKNGMGEYLALTFFK